MAKNPYPFSEIFERYSTILNDFSALELKGKTTPYTSLNGHMTSFLSKEGTLGLRLDNETREEILKNDEIKPMFQHGRPMKDFLEFSLDFMQNDDEIKEVFVKSVEYCERLKPKK